MQLFIIPWFLQYLGYESVNSIYIGPIKYAYVNFELYFELQLNRVEAPAH